MFSEHLNRLFNFTSLMNFLKDLRTNYGQETIKIVRKAENTTRQLAHHRNHLVFNLRCNGECVIPPGLRLKCPINSVKARNIVEKARKNLLREKIRLTNQKISHLQEKKRRLAERFSSDVQQQVNAHLTRIHESVHKQAKCRQQDKLASLISKSKKNNPSEPDLSGTQIKRWVVNLSKCKLNQDQTSVCNNTSPHSHKRHHSSYRTGMQIAPYQQSNPTENRNSRSDQVIKGPEEQHF